MPSPKPAPPLTPAAAVDTPVRRAARAVLRWAVRRGGDRGGPWGEAVLAEFDEVTSDTEAVRWAAGGVWVSLRERCTGVGRCRVGFAARGPVAPRRHHRSDGGPAAGLSTVLAARCRSAAVEQDDPEPLGVERTAVPGRASAARPAVQKDSWYAVGVAGRAARPQMPQLDADQDRLAVAPTWVWSLWPW